MSEQRKPPEFRSMVSMRILLLMMIAAAVVFAPEKTAFGAAATVAIYVRVADDPDEDGVWSPEDNCPFTYNPDQEDNDADGAGDVCDPDDDNDGYFDFLEEAMGTDPLDSASKPLAANLSLLPMNLLNKPGDTVTLSVIGAFEPASGEPILYDMTCQVDYQLSDSNVVLVNDCGQLIAQTEGVTTLWAEQIVNGQAAAESNIASITIDGTAPYVDLLETHPYDSQGMNEDVNGNGVLDAGEDLDEDGVLDIDTGPTPRVPIDTGVIIRVVDNVIGNNIGLNEESIQMLINGVEAPTKARQIETGDLHEIDIGYRNFTPFAFGEVVQVELYMEDAAGNGASYTESFQTESIGAYRQATKRLPVQVATEIGDGRCEVAAVPVPDPINDELLYGSKIIYSCAEPIAPRIGPVDEVPPLGLASSVAIPVNLEPANLFDNPVTLIIPLPNIELQDTDEDGVPDAGMENFDIYQYTAQPTVLWRNVLDVPGWLVPGSRVNHYDTFPPTIEVQVNHFSGIQAGYGCIPPFADFTGHILDLENREVQFLDTSVGEATQWFWEFGDAMTSTQQNPIHTFADSGDFIVKLTVTGPCGSDSKSDTVSIRACDSIHLLAPPDQSEITVAPTLTWSPGCSSTFEVELSTSSNFKTSTLFPGLTENQLTIDEITWSCIPTHKRIYWRVKGSDGAIISVSVETWSFTKQ